ncbi:MAG: hypothetical protein NTY65_16120 [Planctomycetota bacterium]|nr:hypothetical protein [Planctomycetota bacterium]
MRSLPFSSRSLVCLFTLLVIARSSLGSPDAPIEVKPLSDERAKEYNLDAAFYKKCVQAQNILIATSGKVSDYTHLETTYLLDLVMTDLKPPIAQRIRDQKVLCIIVGYDELVSDLPQFTSDKKGEELGFYNWRNRGFLSSQNGRPTVLFSEEDVLEYEGGQRLESVLIHEFAHVIDKSGFDKELRTRLTDAFKHAKAKGLWNDGYAAQRFERVKSKTPVSLFDALVKSFPGESPELFKKCLDGGDILVNGKATHAKVEVTKADKVLIVFGGPKQCYAALNPGEYWAASVQCWYDCGRINDHDHNHVHTRAQLKVYDPEMAKLCEDVLGDSDWRFISPRNRAGKGHLKGYDPDTAPKVVEPDYIEKAGLDYYDKYWKSYWKRLYDKYALPVGPHEKTSEVIRGTQ